MLEIIVVVLLAGLSSYGAAATRMIWPGPSCCSPAVSSLQPSRTSYPKGAIPVFRPKLAGPLEQNALLVAWAPFRPAFYGFRPAGA